MPRQTVTASSMRTPSRRTAPPARPPNASPQLGTRSSGKGTPACGEIWVRRERGARRGWPAYRIAADHVSRVIGVRIGGPWPFTGVDCPLARGRLVKAGDQSDLSHRLAFHVEVTVRRIRPPSGREEKCPAGLIADRHPGTCLDRSVCTQIVDGRRHEA